MPCSTFVAETRIEYCPVQEIDFTGTQGYEALVKRLKDGKRMTVDFEEFLKQRYVCTLLCVSYNAYFSALVCRIVCW